MRLDDDIRTRAGCESRLPAASRAAAAAPAAQDRSQAARRVRTGQRPRSTRRRSGARSPGASLESRRHHGWSQGPWSPREPWSPRLQGHSLRLTSGSLSGAPCMRGSLVLTSMWWIDTGGVSDSERRARAEPEPESLRAWSLSGGGDDGASRASPWLARDVGRFTFRSVGSVGMPEAFARS